MNFLKFLLDKKAYIMGQSILFFVVLYTLNIAKVSSDGIKLVTALVVIINIIILVSEYIPRNLYYGNIKKMLLTNNKVFITRKIYKANHIEAKEVEEIVYILSKRMNDEIAKYKISQEDYREYIETWIHEVKIPISSTSLICENNRNEITNEIIEEINKIENYVNQALYYARSMNVEKDFFVRKIELEKIVRKVIKNNSKALIRNRCNIEIKNMDGIFVNTDIKWIEFIFGQIINNSIKYKKEDKQMKLIFESKVEKNYTLLKIIDNGIGIKKEEINRVFEKGFTGKSGRKYAKSTGIGLYLCNKLCEKLYHNINIESIENEGTTVIITFPRIENK